MTRGRQGRQGRQVLRWTAAAAVLAAVGWHTGTGPFLDGLRSVGPGTLAVGLLLAVPTTVACAWRWHLVAGALGVGIPVRTALRCCYRAQFLNATLPGGVLGDVHRGLSHGRDAGDVPRALRAVVGERLAGQVVQVVLCVVVLLVLAPPFAARWRGATMAVLLVALVAVVGIGVVRPAHLGPRGPSRVLGALRSELRRALLPGQVWPGVVIASVVALAGYVATFLTAARAAGVTAPVLDLLPLVLLVLVAAGLPLNIAGWGPREGMAAWAFGLGGLGADAGVAAATAYGVVVLVASLPGALLLVVTARGGRSAVRHENPLPVREKAAAHG